MDRVGAIVLYNSQLHKYQTIYTSNTSYHFFINTGIRDTAYYWNELRKCLNVYAKLKMFLGVYEK